jgi:hypothetical protein
VAGVEEERLLPEMVQAGIHFGAEAEAVAARIRELHRREGLPYMVGPEGPELRNPTWQPMELNREAGVVGLKPRTLARVEMGRLLS